MVIGKAWSGARLSFLFKDCKVSLNRKESLLKGRSNNLWRKPIEPITALTCSYPQVRAMSSVKRIKSSMEAGRQHRPKKTVKYIHWRMCERTFLEVALA